MHSAESPIEQTDAIKEQIRLAFANSMKINAEYSVTREKGYYGVVVAMPSKNMKAALSVDREMLILISTFSDQQVRTIQTARDLIDESAGRIDGSAVIVIHRDARGNGKLKKWGREQGFAVLPIYYNGDLPGGDDLLRSLSYELFSYDSFDITGPVADDSNFYGRREQAQELARKLQAGQIRACFGIRKIGKTSILHRVINEVQVSYDCTTILIDGQRDAVFALDASQLLNSLAAALDGPRSMHLQELLPLSNTISVSDAAERLRRAITSHPRHILLVFDEIDYLTPTSPTAQHWKTQFNTFWRNIRSVYQATSIERQNLSFLISGVSSKWFSEESIDGVENAALSFVPEEYLSPLPRGAAIAMIKKLGRVAGLGFSDQVSAYIADSCANMPFWIRKACSHIHSKVEVGLRPFQPQQALVEDYIKDFVATDGVAMSEVALAHLFRVYPELRSPALQCAEGSIVGLSPKVIRTLEKYGIIQSQPRMTISGQMMSTGLMNFPEDQPSVSSSSINQTERPDYGDWADELAIIGRRRNLVERKVRDIAANFIRFSSITSGGASAKERVLKCVDSKRAADLQRFDLDQIMPKLFWLELISVIKKEWDLFAKIFGDKGTLDKYTTIVNERPDAHAKDLDPFDVSYHRAGVAWFEERLSKV